MEHVRRGFVVGTAVAVTVALAGCSAGRPAHRSWQAPVDEPLAGAPLGNRVDRLDPAAILQRAQAATAGAKSVHVKGELVAPTGGGPSDSADSSGSSSGSSGSSGSSSGSSGSSDGSDEESDADAKPFSVDMRFTSTGSEGRIVEDGTTAYMTRVQNQVWFKGDAKFWSEVDGTLSAVAYRDKYVQVPSSDRKYTGIVENTYVERLTKKLMGKPGTLEKGRTDHINGHAAIALENKTPGAGGTIWVATEGAPYLLRMEAAAGAKQAGGFDFLAYDERVDVHAPEPKDVVDKDLTTSQGGSGGGSSGSGSGSASGSGTGGGTSSRGSTVGSTSSGAGPTRRPDSGEGTRPPVPGGIKNDPLLFF